MKGSIEKTATSRVAVGRCRSIQYLRAWILDILYLDLASAIQVRPCMRASCSIAPSARQDHALLEPACASALMIRISRSLSFSAATTGSDSDSAFRGAAEVTTTGTAS